MTYVELRAAVHLQKKEFYEQNPEERLIWNLWMIHCGEKDKTVI
jgi:hypothetical protein